MSIKNLVEKLSHIDIEAKYLPCSVCGVFAKLDVRVVCSSSLVPAILTTFLPHLVTEYVLTATVTPLTFYDQKNKNLKAETLIINIKL